MCVSYAKADIINYIVIRSEFAFDNRMGISDLKTIAIEYIPCTRLFKKEKTPNKYSRKKHTLNKKAKVQQYNEMTRIQ